MSKLLYIYIRAEIKLEISPGKSCNCDPCRLEFKPCQYRSQFGFVTAEIPAWVITVTVLIFTDKILNMISGNRCKRRVKQIETKKRERINE